MSDTSICWRDLYRRALLEVDPVRLLEYIDSAERAIRAERDLLPGSPSDEHDSDRQTMDDALYALSSLRRSAMQSRGGVLSDSK